MPFLSHAFPSFPFTHCLTLIVQSLHLLTHSFISPPHRIPCPFAAITCWMVSEPGATVRAVHLPASWLRLKQCRQTPDCRALRHRKEPHECCPQRTLLSCRADGSNREAGSGNGWGVGGGEGEEAEQEGGRVSGTEKSRLGLGFRV